ncbi:MAG: Nramp family divalent metal transporter [Streptosporangiaceae bacterium]
MTARTEEQPGGPGEEPRGEFAERIKSKYLPPVPYRDLPEPPKSPLKIIGASVILAGVSIGSGETVLWPYITYQVGLVLMWAALVGFLTQYFINMEIERYTLATGETVVTGFTRMWKPWGILFVLMAIITNVWPGWGTGAATLLTFALGFGNVVYVACAALVAIGLALTLSPVVYRAVEKIEGVLIAFIVIFLILVLIVGTNATGWAAFGASFSHTGQFPPFAAVGGVAALLGAIAFAGAGGASNLVQSNWIRDKGMGMGAHIPQLTSPITGEEQAVASLGYTFRPTEENMRRWKKWWRAADIEQFVTFFILGWATLIIMSVLAYVTVTGQSLPSEDLAFLHREGEILGQQVGNWFKLAFWAAVMTALFSTEIAIIDLVGRITADSLKISFWRGSERVTESRIYIVIVWLLIAFGCAILLGGFSQPLALLIVSSALGGVMMFIYSILLTMMNTRYLPKGIRLTGFRFLVMLWAIVFFGYFSVQLVIAQFSGGG